MWVQAGEAVTLDTTFLTAAARSFAHRWMVPSAKREVVLGWARVRERTLPPEPRWADDWFPGEEDRAMVTVMLYKDGRVRTVVAKSLSGDTLFTQSLASMVDAPLPTSPAVPTIPAELKADSLMLKLSFGFDDVMGTRGVQHFAAIQTPALLEGPIGGAAGGGAGSGRRNRPGGSANEGSVRLTLKFDVTATGEVKPNSIEVIESTDAGAATRVRDMLSRVRLKPATSNCRDIPLTVLQFITF